MPVNRFLIHVSSGVIIGNVEWDRLIVEFVKTNQVLNKII